MNKQDIKQGTKHIVINIINNNYSYDKIPKITCFINLNFYFLK